MMVHRNLLLIDLKNYVLKKECLLLRYVHGLKRIYFFYLFSSKTVFSFDNLCESMMSEQILSKGIEELTKKVDNPNDAAELIKKMDKMIKSDKNSVLIIAY